MGLLPALLIDGVETGESRNSLLPVHLTVRESSVCSSGE